MNEAGSFLALSTACLPDDTNTTRLRVCSDRGRIERPFTFAQKPALQPDKENQR